MSLRRSITPFCCFRGQRSTSKGIRLSFLLCSTPVVCVNDREDAGLSCPAGYVRKQATPERGIQNASYAGQT